MSVGRDTRPNGLEYTGMLLQLRFSNRNFRPKRFNRMGEAGNFPKCDSLLKGILPLHPLQTRQLLHCLETNRNSRLRA